MEIPRLPWDSFLEQFKWKQGDHMTLVGPTKRGKTTLAHALLPMRKWVIIFATKKKDPLITKFRKDGYHLVRTSDEIHKDVSHRFILAPPLTSKESRPSQRVEFEKALARGFKSGGWTFYLDEARYISDTLRLADDCELLWQQGRTLGVTMVVGTQRPVRIPLTAYDQATHLFFFRENDDRNLKTLGGLGGVDNKLIRETVAMLGFHDALYLNTATGDMVITKVAI